MIPSNKRKTKALIRLRGCTGWSAPMLFANHRRQVFSRLGPNKLWFFSLRSFQSMKRVWMLIKCNMMWHFIWVFTICQSLPFRNHWYIKRKCRVLDSRPQVRASPGSLRCGPCGRHIYPSLVLV